MPRIKRLVEDSARIGPAKHEPWALSGKSTVTDYLHPIHEHMHHPLRVVVGIGVFGHIPNGREVEDHNVGDSSGPQHPPFGHPEHTGW